MLSQYMGNVMYVISAGTTQTNSYSLKYYVNQACNVIMIQTPDNNILSHK